MREADEKGKYTKAEIEEAMLRLQFSLVEAKIRSDSTKLLKRLDFEDKQDAERVSQRETGSDAIPLVIFLPLQS